MNTSTGQTSCSRTVRSLHCWTGFGIPALHDDGWLDEASAAENFHKCISSFESRSVEVCPWAKEPPVCDLDGRNIQRKTSVPLARTSSKVFKNHVVWISSSLQSESCLEGRLLGRALCALAPLPLPRCPQRPPWPPEVPSLALSSPESLSPSLSPKWPMMLSSRDPSDSKPSSSD